MNLERNMKIPRNPNRPRVDVDRGRPKRLEIPGGQPGEKFVFILNE
jgi:hypothetical protein